MKKMKAQYNFLLIFLLICCHFITGCGKTNAETPNTMDHNEEGVSYGVFLGLNSEDISRTDAYDIIVIDAQYFTEEEISSLHEKGKTVYTYLNVGSLEEYRDYYKDYSYLSLGVYENWEDERWIAVSDPSWIEFMGELSESLAAKGVDGFFVDNLDVYYIYPEKSIYDGLYTIMENLSTTGKEIIVNGGDRYVTEYLHEKGKSPSVISGVNQETVFSKIYFDENEFGRADEEDEEYFKEYIEECHDYGLDVYLLEYTTDPDLIDMIDRYCQEHNYLYYISDSLELD